jgi:hypothetical protein
VALSVSVLLLGCASVTRGQTSPAVPASQPAADVSDAAFDRALADAAAAERGQAAFVAALQSVAPRFTVIEPATAPGQAAWQKVELNARGKRVDAVRFRVPDGPRRDLLWAFAHPPGMSVWYIAPAAGRPGTGFRNFQKTDLPDLFGDAPPPGITAGVVQTLSGKHLEPGREYLLWFTFEDETPHTLYLTLALLPTTGDPTAKAAAEALGLPRPVASSGDRDAEAPK